MNCTFKILWFEDELTWFNMIESRVKEHMSKYCLKEYINRKNGDDFDLVELCGNEYDLILMDYKLASEETGDKIIYSIRAQNILTDILFYSSQYDEMLLAIKNASPPIDGVYYANRKLESFQPKLEKLIDKVVKRSEDLVNLRGFVLDNTCDFEVRVIEVLNIVWQKFSEGQKDILKEIVHSTIKSKLKRQEINHNKITNKEPIFPPAINDKYFFNHSERLFILTRVISILQNDYGFEPKQEHENFKIKYEKDISQYRNALGHRKSGENTIEICKEPIPIDTDLHQKMRRNINNYDSLIMEIELFITQNI